MQHWQITNQILIVAIFIYFIHDQYEYGPVQRLRYLLLPGFTLYQYFTQMRWTTFNIFVSLLIALVSAAISYYQAGGTKLRTERIAVSYFELNGQEVPIYRRRITARGGSRYLIGWGLIVLVQLVIEILIVHEKISSQHIVEVFLMEVLSDFSSAFRFADAGKGSWAVWALTSFSSLFYMFWLMHRSTMFKEAIRNNQSLIGVKDES